MARPRSPKALGRFSGAVGNCLARLTKANKTKRVGDKPVRYGPRGVSRCALLSLASAPAE